jgi:hypothetical protein
VGSTTVRDVLIRAVQLLLKLQRWQDAVSALQEYLSAEVDQWDAYTQLVLCAQNTDEQVCPNECTLYVLGSNYTALKTEIAFPFMLSFVLNVSQTAISVRAFSREMQQFAPKARGPHLCELKLLCDWHSKQTGRQELDRYLAIDYRPHI